MGIDIVRGDFQSGVLVTKAIQGKINGAHHQVAGIPGKGFGALTGELEFKLSGAQGFYRQGVVNRQGQAKAVVARAQIGACTGDLDRQPLACRDERTISRGGLR